MTEKTEPASALQPVDSAPAAPPDTVPDDPPLPDYTTDAETDAFWDGVTHGVRSAGGVSAEDEAKLRWRTDGWTPERQRAFVVMLSLTGSVKAAAEEVGLSRESAYHLRRKPEGRLFARLWDAARLIARDRLADEAMERALNGTTETIVYHGEETGRRLRHDNRHLQWTLARLDREVSRFEDSAAPARRAATAFDALADALGAGPEDAEAMLEILDEPVDRSERLAALDEKTLIAQFEKARELLGIERTDPADIDISDLDSAESETWTDIQWARAERSGAFQIIDERDEADRG
ncbi:hypothetical protein HFP57_01220 [Parasphingopyxis algicola]|uniref:hypothetical protein n=1 Tax=Parasphingopyxis algicola TaxID=2026624 RepID=UPI0015A22C50|nr:hypothetical protein [Parasphingopyxis algicola]QLC23787.1 hypothetical protein HFP57_01220 [Parasphingopyxis algicola]